MSNEFLSAVLGAGGAKAIESAARRIPGIQEVLVSRAIISWVENAADTYSGSVPGLDNSHLEFQKSEGAYSGYVATDDGIYDFEALDPFQMAASVAVALGVTPPQVNPWVRSEVLAKFGTSIDTLVKAQQIIKRKILEDMEKVEGPGPAAAPQPPQGPVPPAAPAMQAPGTKAAKAKMPKLPKPPKPKMPPQSVGKSEAARTCGVCGGTQFDARTFRGCVCFQDLAKSIHCSTYADGYVLEFAQDVEPEAAQALMAAIRGSDV